MELNYGRLRATLVAGGIRPTDETLATLSAGLSGIAHGYHIERVISSEAKSDAELTKELSQLQAAFRTAVSILDADTSGLGQIEVLLSRPGDRNRIREFLEELRSLSSRIEVLLIMLAQNTAIRKRRQNPETWFFLAVHDLFATLADDPKPGIAGPLHRFTKRCAVLIEPRIKVPENENSFQKRLTAALGRRTGKIHVFPWRFIPGKTTPSI
jgi:hypothetical protein